MIDKRRARLPKIVANPVSISGKQLRDNEARQRKIAYASDSGVYIPHVYQVFNDPDFLHDIGQLRTKLEKLYYENVSLITDGTDEHLLREDKAVIKELADKYCITLEDIGIFADGKFALGSAYGRRMEEFGGLDMLGNSGAPHVLCYHIGPKTTIEQINADWDYIKSMRTVTIGAKNTKNKSPEDPELIYAIFKARTKNGLKYSKIFYLYQAGELEGYKGKNTKQYTSEDSLERHYRKYMPQKQANNIEAQYIPTAFEKYEPHLSKTQTDG